MKIYIASDHAGYWLKEDIKQDLRSYGHEVVDVGNNQYDPNDDYPDFVIACAERVADDYGSLGIVLGRSGNGESIAANKVMGIRAALCFTESMAKKAREDNNANVLSLGADYIDAHKAERVVSIFIDTPFPGEERHARRVDKITSYENTQN